MTTPTKQRRPTPTPKYDPVPPEMHALRTGLTVVAVAAIVIGPSAAAVMMGRGGSPMPGAAVFLFGAVLAYVAHQAWLYRLFTPNPQAVIIEGGLVADDGRTATPVAAKAPKQRKRAKSNPAPAPVPAVATLQPAPGLGVEFRYIVRFTRHLVDKGRTEVLASLDELYQAHDWSPDLDEVDRDQFRLDVEFVAELVALLPGVDPLVTFEQVLDGTADPANPLAFLCELTEYSPAAAAVAALMLVRSNPNVAGEVFDGQMVLWTALGLPYRLADVIFERSSTDDEYHPHPVGTVRRAAGEHPAAAVPPPAAFRPPTVLVLPEPTEPAPASSVAPALVDDGRGPFTLDELLHAAELIITSQFGSLAMLQRKMRIGFAKAGHLMDRLEHHGVVAEASDGASTRIVMVNTDELDETVAFIRDRETDSN